MGGQGEDDAPQAHRGALPQRGRRGVKDVDEVLRVAPLRGTRVEDGVDVGARRAHLPRRLFWAVGRDGDASLAAPPPGGRAAEGGGGGRVRLDRPPHPATERLAVLERLQGLEDVVVLERVRQVAGRGELQEVGPVTAHWTSSSPPAPAYTTG